VYDFILVVNSNFGSSVHRFRDIDAYMCHMGKCAFMTHFLGDLGITYALHCGLVGKLVVDFLLVVIELFSLALTDSATRRNMSKSMDFSGVGHFGAKI
jgi:hypothetical protein